LKLFLINLLITISSLINAKEVKVALYYSIPPYVFADESGISVSIVKEAFKLKGHTVVFTHATINRSLELFREGHVDSTSNATEDKSVPDAYYSEPFMEYQNVIFALKSNHYNIHNLTDLKDFNVIAFQNATNFIGKDFALVTKSMGNKYSETTDQKKQTNMLLQSRTDLVIFDKSIFKYYMSELISEGTINKNIQVDMFDIIPPVRHSMIFHDKVLLKDFNDGLAILKKSGRFDEIYKQYSEKYFEVKP
jgi:polar amino acid transport system substrate-binding protein